MSESTLRDLRHEDFEVIFSYHCEAEAVAMSGVDRRDRAAYRERWGKFMADPRVVKKAVLQGGEVAGYIVCFDRDGRRELGYWIGKKFWGQGLASRAVKTFLEQVRERPLWAVILESHVASLAVAEKAGFSPAGEVVLAEEGRPPRTLRLLRLG